MLDITRRQLLLVLGGVLAITTIAVGIYGLVRQPDAPPSVSAIGEAASDVEEPVDLATPVPVAVEDRPLPHTTDPIRYAGAIAASLFDWDTTSGLLPTDYTAAVLADADPSGEETPGLLTDVATYLPSTEEWLDLATMDVSQSLTIDEAVVPESWAAAVDQARGQLRPGTTAVTITGTRHRKGMWDGEVAEISYDVAFTVFVACPPAFERCRVLRLSQLDNPLS